MKEEDDDNSSLHGENATAVRVKEKGDKIPTPTGVHPSFPSTLKPERGDSKLIRDFINMSGELMKEANDNKASAPNTTRTVSKNNSKHDINIGTGVVNTGSPTR